ncbi:unnamed protein product, partial [Allacma fusca]
MVLVSFFLTNVLCSISPMCFPTYAPPTVSEQRIRTRSSLFNGVLDRWPVVKTLEGDVRGFPMSTGGGRDILAFDGIPFAEPPTGQRRFRSPVRKKPWGGIWNADSRTNNCIQLDLTRFYTVTGSEDLLAVLPSICTCCQSALEAGISQSACAFNPWSIYRNPRETASKFSRNLNCNFDDTSRMINCLRKQSAHDITAAQVKLQEWLNHPTVLFAPVVEHNHSEAFLTESPRDLYAKGDVARVPWIIGFVPNEGNIYNILMMLIPVSFFSFNRNFQTLAPMTLGFRGLGLKEDEIARRIKKQYFGNEAITYRNQKEHGD